jgi:hypothetical protein
MLYFTQLIYIIRGQESIFHEFEDHVLPLLTQYGGSLLLRVRPSATDIIACEGEAPYEVHLCAFKDQAGFDAYAQDKHRQQFLHLKNESVKSMLLIKGEAL